MSIIIIIVVVVIIVVIVVVVVVVVVIVVVVVVVLLFKIYTINLFVVRLRSCRVIYYFDTPALGRTHQSFGRVTSHSTSPHQEWLPMSQVLVIGRHLMNHGRQKFC